MKVRRLIARVKALLADQGAGIATTIAVATPILIGSAGMGIETGLWYMIRRQAQSAADAAAVGGLYQYLRHSTGDDANTLMVQVARTDAARNAFGVAAGTTVAVSRPPTTGPNTSNSRAVEAVIARQVPLFFSAIFSSTPTTVRVRAVAATRTVGSACILSLDPTASGGVTNQGNTNIDAASCIVAANSNHASAINATGSTTLVASSLWTPGDYNQGGSASITLSSPANTHVWPLDDPYAGYTIPSTLGSCNFNNLVLNGGSHTLNPGVYCGGIDIRSHTTVTFQPGTYYLNRGDFNANAQAVVRCNCSVPGSGVTIVFTSTAATNQIGTAVINGGADVRLQAPAGPASAMYPYPGLVFFQDRRAPTTGTARLNGGSTMVISGGIYFPQQEVLYTGNNGTTASTCVQIVARLVRFSGTSNIDASQCANYGVLPVNITSVRVVE
jgi:Putative Flp pilus-assembly TadE/G-like